MTATGDRSNDLTRASETVTLSLDARQFSREAILRASYWLSKDLHIEIPPSESEDLIRVIVRANPVVATLDNPRPKSLADLVVDFQDSLIDAELRVQILRETSAVRELLLAKAFSEAGVLEDGPPGSFDDPVLAESAPQAQRTLITIENKDKLHQKIVAH